MTIDLMDYVIEFHKDAERQGPGNGEATRKALQYIPELGKNARILDIGCGTGAQTMVLAKNTKAQIIAVDMLQEFLDKLQEKIDRKNLSNRVVIKQGLMDNLDFQEKSFDVIWSEGAIYNIGFEKGLLEWIRLLKDGGYVVVSEISWFTDKRPKEIEEYWIDAYSEIDAIDTKLSIIEKCGYDPISHFVLQESCWMDHYYTPMLLRSDSFLEKYNYEEGAKEFIKIGLDEIKMYEKYKEYYSYVFLHCKKDIEGGRSYVIKPRKQ